MFNWMKKNADTNDEANVGQHLNHNSTDTAAWNEKSTPFWQENMTSLQFEVTRRGATERAFTGRYNDEKREGTFLCSACGLELFRSAKKFDSGTGWPSFFEVFRPENVAKKIDRKFGTTRIEVLCSRCESHLGHVFQDGPEPTRLRYCINSVSLILDKDLKNIDK